MLDTTLELAEPWISDDVKQAAMDAVMRLRAKHHTEICMTPGNIHPPADLTRHYHFLLEQIAKTAAAWMPRADWPTPRSNAAHGINAMWFDKPIEPWILDNHAEVSYRLAKANTLQLDAPGAPDRVEQFHPQPTAVA
jgi:hypothetical protein